MNVFIFYGNLDNQRPPRRRSLFWPLRPGSPKAALDAHGKATLEACFYHLRGKYGRIMSSDFGQGPDAPADYIRDELTKAGFGEYLEEDAFWKDRIRTKPLNERL